MILPKQVVAQCSADHESQFCRSDVPAVSECVYAQHEYTEPVELVGAKTQHSACGRVQCYLVYDGDTARTHTHFLVSDCIS